MRKGDLKKQVILETAETLFCKNGYEATSVQDIIDILHTSKGSFYHHFISKESVLSEICARRASKSAADAAEKCSKEQTPIQNLNILISGMIPITGEKLAFLLMLLPVFRTTEGVQIKNCYCRELSVLFAPMIEAEIKRGMSEEKLSVSSPYYSAQLITSVVNIFWCTLCDTVLKNEEAGNTTDSGELLALTDFYRIILERILFAPYGSLMLVDLPEIKLLTEQIHLHWKNRQ